MHDYTTQVNLIASKYQSLQQENQVLTSQMSVAQKQLSKIEHERVMLDKADDALTKVKPLMSASSLEHCERLANAAIKAVFQKDHTVVYSAEHSRFMLNKGDYMTDLAASEGGGLLAVISFVFSVYLLVKLNKRRFVALDEHFTQIGSVYIPRFLEFLQVMCKDLAIDLLLVTHDKRITLDYVDHAYYLEQGKTQKLK